MQKFVFRGLAPIPGDCARGAVAADRHARAPRCSLHCRCSLRRRRRRSKPRRPSTPIVAHFREYRAALERNDLPAAETAAAAALAASEAAHGSRTAVLALNLANVRLELGGEYDALTPARTAHALATRFRGSGVDAAARGADPRAARS